MEWPQITIIVLLSISLGIGLVQHGENKKGKESFWTTLIGALITVFLLIKGGFFK